MENTKRRILLVDDDPSVFTTLGDFLQFEGYEVICAPSGEDALIKLRAHQPDLIILDMGMPGMGGVGFLDRITNPDGSTIVPVLVLTARATMAEYFADKQIAGFLAKPCDPNDLLMQVSQTLFMTPSDGPQAIKPMRRILVADGDAATRQTLVREFSQAGFEVASASTGLEAMEQAITIKPDALVMRLELDGASADEIVVMLKRLPNTKNVKTVVYGIDLPEANLEHVANLRIPQACMVRDVAINKIIDRTMSIT